MTTNPVPTRGLGLTMQDYGELAPEGMESKFSDFLAALNEWSDDQIDFQVALDRQLRELLAQLRVPIAAWGYYRTAGDGSTDFLVNYAINASLRFPSATALSPRVTLGVPQPAAPFGVEFQPVRSNSSANRFGTPSIINASNVDLNIFDASGTLFDQKLFPRGGVWKIIQRVDASGEERS